MSGRTRVSICVAALLVVACSRTDVQKSAAADTTAAVAPPVSPRRISEMSIRTVQITPTPVNRLQQAAVRAEFVNAVPAATMTLSWFGPDGWLVCDQMGELADGSATFSIPAGAFPAAGTYHYEIHSDTVDLAGGTADVTG